MKRKKPYLLAGLVLLLFLLCTACGNTEGQIAPQDDPNEGLGGGLSEDTVNDFSGFEGIWLGEADNDYDSMEFDAEGNWTLYLSGEVVDDGYLRYEPEWEANGNWSYYQRAPGAEPAEMDCGVFTYSMDEVSTYYADSTMYDGVSYRVFEVDEDSLVWGDEGVYYMME